MGKDAAINALGGDKIAEVNFTTRMVIKVQSVKRASVKEKKVKQLKSKAEKAIVLGPTREVAQGHHMIVDKPTALGPIRELGQENPISVDQPWSIGPLGDPTQNTKSTNPNLMATLSSSVKGLNKMHTLVKWKRAARNKGGIPDLGVISSLGSGSVQVAGKVQESKVSNFSLGIEEDEGVGSDTVDVLVQEDTQQVVLQSESVTSQDVLALDSEFPSTDRSLPVHRVQ
ncbi:hypothetical protein Q3G72_031883 [Acer saccharum]|nr:hypothetical protein Q3G72_031883 [Acer saccharum]